MTANDFVIWINGFFELTDLKEGEGIFLSDAQVKTIRDHIGLVLTKVTQDRGLIPSLPIPTSIPDNGTTPISPGTTPVPWTPFPGTWPYTGPTVTWQTFC